MNVKPQANFEELTELRACGVEGVDELLWVKTDTGAFGNMNDGPLRDWVKGKEHFLEHVFQFNTVVQAGGNCGMYPRFYKNYFETVYTFEPSKLNYYCLDYNCSGPGFKKFNGGLGNTTKKFQILERDTKNVGTHKILESDGDVQMYRIDDLQLKHCDLIHLDVEGYEEKAILGGIDTIKKFKPVVITERSGGAKILADLGYKAVKTSYLDVVYVVL